jgi:hypothetical protein
MRNMLSSSSFYNEEITFMAVNTLSKTGRAAPNHPTISGYATSYEKFCYCIRIFSIYRWTVNRLFMRCCVEVIYVARVFDYICDSLVWTTLKVMKKCFIEKSSKVVVSG